MPAITSLQAPLEALDILYRLRQAGFEAYFCGGCVRDALLGKKPKDFDIACSAPPDRVENLFPGSIPIGKAFGVILVQGMAGGRYEVATFRSENGYSDGRRPDMVTFSSAPEDAKRRDFTMNALFFDPSSGQVVDYVGGVADIRRKLLRTVGNPNERFREDHLRLLRAVRFAARTGFSLDQPTRRAMFEMADLLRIISPERVAAELEAMLLGGNSRDAFAMLREFGFLPIILPEAAALSGVKQPPEFHPEGDVWIHTLLMLLENDLAKRGETSILDFSVQSDIGTTRGMDRGRFNGAEYLMGIRECRAALGRDQECILAWSALLHDIGKPATFTVDDRIRFNGHDSLGAEMAVAILERLRRSRRLIDGVGEIVRRHINFSTLRRMRKSKLRRWLAGDDFPVHLELHRLDCVASHRMLGNWFFGIESWREEKKRPPVPEPLLRGGDIVGLGIPPGPEIGRLLRLIEDARLEGEICNKDEALGLVLRNCPFSPDGTVSP
ncbi:MAG: HDIG domain-containing protein [Planctomycetota bacterium]|jgi:poly(A) polymerase|nr:HDIG domain-containing protein [Planctomycetota bacterium]